MAREWYFISGRSRGGAPLILGKKEEMTEGKMAAMASKSRPGPPLAQGLDPSLFTSKGVQWIVKEESLYLLTTITPVIHPWC